MKTILDRFRTFMPVGKYSLGLFIAAILLVDPALATTPANEAILGFASILAVFIHILTFLVLLIMSWGGDLIGTTFLTSPEAMEGIQPMWVFVRNIVNISFVLVLLFLAFANLFSSISGGQGNWTIKDKLPRVIIALIAVNFSLLIFRVAIDAVHVGTITILSIADTAIEEKKSFDLDDILTTPINNKTFEKCSLDDPKIIKPKSGESPSFDKNRNNEGCYPFYHWVEHAMCPSGQADSDCIMKFNKSKDGNTLIIPNSPTEQNIFWAFGTYFQKLELLPILAGKLNSLSGVVSSTIFSGIMAILYAVAWVAIFVALAVRIVMLWFFMIASPVLVAAGIMGVGSSSLGDVQKRLVTNLIMPIKIAAAFALSFVMIATMVKVSPEMATSVFVPGEALKAFWGVETSPFGIMWQAMTVIVFWMAVWWALSGSEAEMVTNGIKSATQKAGGYVGTWALDKVRLPVPNVDKANQPSILSLRNFGTILDREKSNMMRTSDQNLSKVLFGDNEVLASLNKILNAIQGQKNLQIKDFVSRTGGVSAIEGVSATQGQWKDIVDSFGDNARRKLAGSAGLDPNADSKTIASQLEGINDESRMKSILSNAGILKAASTTETSETNNSVKIDAVQTEGGQTTNINIEVSNQADFESAIQQIRDLNPAAKNTVTNDDIRKLSDFALNQGLQLEGQALPRDPGEAAKKVADSVGINMTD